MKKSKSDKKLIVLASISALVFIAVGIFLLVRNIDYKSNGVKTYAVITKIETDYSPTDESTNHYVYVRFEAEGKIIEGKLDVYTSSMREGQTVPVRYMPDNPENFIYGKAMFLPSVLFFIAGGVLIAFLIIPIKNIIKKSKLEKLKSTGQKTETTIDESTIKSNTRILGKTPVRIVCSDENGQTFTAKFYTNAPEKFRAGTKVTFYCDGEKYIADTDDVTPAEDGSNFFVNEE